MTRQNKKPHRYREQVIGHLMGRRAGRVSEKCREIKKYKLSVIQIVARMLTAEQVINIVNIVTTPNGGRRRWALDSSH